jgi:hypothetical protein
MEHDMEGDSKAKLIIALVATGILFSGSLIKIFASL